MLARFIKAARIPSLTPSRSPLSTLPRTPYTAVHTARTLTAAMSNSALIPRSERVAHFEQDECQAVNLGQGFMNFSPPEFVIEAAREAVLRNDCNQYSHPKGRPRLRNALAKSYSPLFNRQLDPETEIVVTAGANEGIFSIFAGYLDQGSEVILMEPFFDQYISNITMNGGVPVYCPIRPKGDTSKDMAASEWKIDIKELESKITPRSKIIVLNTPHNPIGKVFSQEELEEIGALAEKHNLLIISDEVYDRLYFNPKSHERIATLKGFWERTITVGSGGKTFGTTGWRVGWLIGPKALVEPALAAHTRIVFCVNSPLQEAIAIGFEKADELGFFGSQVGAYEHKREKLLSVFRELGLPCTIPDGSYFILVNMDKIQVPKDYVFPELLHSRPKDFRTCYWLTKEIGVCAIPPTEFYSKPNRVLAEDFARFAFCKTDETLDAAAERLLKLKPFIKQV